MNDAAAAPPTEGEPAGQGGETAAAASTVGETERATLHLRRWPRRRRPRPGTAPAGGPERRLLQGPATAGAEGAAEGGEAAAAVPPASQELRARRRRRRRRPGEARPQAAAQGPSEPGAAAGAEGGAASAAPETSSGQASANRPPRPRHRRRGRSLSAGDAGAERPSRDDRPQRRDRDERPRRADERGPRGDRREGRRDGGPRDRRGRPGGRDAPARKVERKLYQVDAVVDRGFEDVEEEGGSRRVHWTILKRTTADQISRKALSAIYVLQRDGADTEFPSLGAARSAVNKTIVHPEKLTRSKAEYAADKK